MTKCDYCSGTVANHNIGCPQEEFYTRGFTSAPEPVIQKRTEGEKLAFIQGYEAAIRNLENHGAKFAKNSIELVKKIV